MPMAFPLEYNKYYWFYASDGTPPIVVQTKPDIPYVYDIWFIGSEVGDDLANLSGSFVPLARPPSKKRAVLHWQVEK